MSGPCITREASPLPGGPEHAPAPPIPSRPTRWAAAVARRRDPATLAAVLAAAAAAYLAAPHPWTRAGAAPPAQARPGGHDRQGESPRTVPAPPTAAHARDPLSIRPQRQQNPNTCEVTALSMLLAAAGAPRSQAQLMRRLPRDGPADPTVRPDGTWVWGDPERGFVGRAQGGGTAGGYGVYVGPILRLARRYVSAEDLTRRPLSAVIDRLRRGHAVMAWVGLSDGPYRRWVTPAGRRVLGNFGEHAILLLRYRKGVFTYDDPLTGTRKSVSRNDFTTMWRRLGRRAISA